MATAPFLLNYTEAQKASQRRMHTFNWGTMLPMEFFQICSDYRQGKRYYLNQYGGPITNMDNFVRRAARNFTENQVQAVRTAAVPLARRLETGQGNERDNAIDLVPGRICALANDLTKWHRIHKEWNE